MLLPYNQNMPLPWLLFLSLSLNHANCNGGLCCVHVSWHKSHVGTRIFPISIPMPPSIPKGTFFHYHMNTIKYYYMLHTCISLSLSLSHNNNNNKEKEKEKEKARQVYPQEAASGFQLHMASKYFQYPSSTFENRLVVTQDIHFILFTSKPNPTWVHVKTGSLFSLTNRACNCEVHILQGE